jgi:hypothetical protein
MVTLLGALSKITARNRAGNCAGKDACAPRQFALSFSEEIVEA